MAQETYTEQHPLDGDLKGFAAVRSDMGGGVSEFLAPAGGTPYTQNGKPVAPAVVELAVGSGAGATIGTTSGTAVVTDAAGTLQQYLRGLIVLILDRLPGGANTAHDAVDTGAPLKIGGKANGSIPSAVADGDRVNAWMDPQGRLHVDDDQLHAAVGSTTGTAVTTDSIGTLQQYLRGLVKWTSERMPTSLGQKAMTASLPVVLPSDQSAIPASQSGTWNITNVGGTVSLPTGASTAALQSAEATLLGAVTETAPTTDTASSGLNGRLQRLAQRVAPASTGSYGIAVAVGTSATPIVMANSSTKRATIKNSETDPNLIIWLGFDATVTPGKAGKNIGPLYPGESWSEPYSGDVYGITASGVAYAAPARMS